MDHTKKMILVPPEFFNRINEPRPIVPSLSDPTISQTEDTSQMLRIKSPMNDLDYEMNQILNETNLNDREKWVRYYQILQRYFQLGKIQRQPVELGFNGFTISDQNILSDENIVSTFPPTMQKQAERLLNWIKRSNSDISWDEKGEVTIKGVIITGSNIIDLIGDLLRYRKTVIPPTGQNVFIRALKETNIPEELIGNREHLKQMSALNKIYNEDVYKSPGDMILPTPPKIIKTFRGPEKSGEESTPVSRRYSNPRRSLLDQIGETFSSTQSPEQKLEQILKNKSTSTMNLRSASSRKPPSWLHWD